MRVSIVLSRPLSHQHRNAKIYEKIGGCLNDVKPESIKPNDKVCLYSLRIDETLFGSIKKDDWNKQIGNTNNIVIVERSNTRTTKTMCFNEELRDAIDDLCDILSKWNDRLLSKYNEDPKVPCFNNIKDLLESTDNTVWEKIEKTAKKLGGLTDKEISAMGLFKLARNRGVHKGATLPRKIALERLDIASTTMSPICKQGLKKCIEVINYK
ncbi:hypothetical protein RclHR1_34500002 [Rhizophagus clarus]|uniref:Uncharacterized protein n=1 Tax=Rhizophagus clarus TaxID=94130 RepID=A0A2Z6RRU2_9GLOM|nr:hypothetical protein RclHR1_34500002 [Rhizophagus clarus]GES77210.1 hypothetical protein GLOIN_2v1733770 [Rhizophagus clarus]